MRKRKLPRNYPERSPADVGNSAKIKKVSNKSKAPRTRTLENCPICGERDTKHFFTSPDRLHGTPGDYKYDICIRCRTVFQNPMVVKEDLALCYPPRYAPYNYNPEMPELNFEAGGKRGFFAGSREAIRRAIAKAVWSEPSPGVAGLTGRVLARSRLFRERAFYGIVHDECLPNERGKYHALDVGCGAGWMLKRLKQVGWRVEGIEWDEKAAKIAADRTGARVWAGDFKEAELPKAKYHLIHLSHVFEHFDEPLSLLERFYELLAGNGRLVLIYPNPHSFDSRWFREYWYHWDPPRHLIFPTPESFTDHARRLGFVNIKVNSIVAKHCWLNSKAYKMGLHPDENLPDLNFSERLGYWYQRFITRLGATAGSELIVVLEKP